MLKTVPFSAAGEKVDTGTLVAPPMVKKFEYKSSEVKDSKELSLLGIVPVNALDLNFNDSNELRALILEGIEPTILFIDKSTYFS